MVVLYVLPGTGISGGINVVLEHASRLQARGHTAYILNAIGPMSLNWNPILGYSLFSKFNVDHLNYLRSTSIDVIVATGWQTVFEIADMGLTARSFAYFLQADESKFAPSGSVDAALAHDSRLLPFDYFGCATWLRRLVAAQGHDCAPMVNGVNREIFHPSAPLVPKGGKLRVLIEGPSAQPRKRIDDAFIACSGHRSDIELWYVSSGGQLKDWHRPDLYLTDLPMAEMAKVYSSCDLVMKLSSAEGMFGPPLEMMACGGTAITSDCDGHEEYVRHGVNALVAPVGDVEAASLHLRSLIDDPGLLARLKRGGAETARRFDWDATIDRLEALFASRCAGREARSFRSFMRDRGGKLNPSSLVQYRTVSYGSLPAPSRPEGAVVSVDLRTTQQGHVLRIKGWSVPPRVDPIANSVQVNVAGRAASFACTKDRDDLAEGFGERSRQAGFDILFPLAAGLSAEHAAGDLTVRSVDGGKPDDPPIGSLRVLARERTPPCGSDGAVPDPHVEVGVVETVDEFRSFTISSEMSVDPSPKKLLVLEGVTTVQGGFIFLQRSGDEEFANYGVRVAGDRDDEHHVFHELLDVPASMNHADDDIVILTSRHVKLGLLRIVSVFEP